MRAVLAICLFGALACPVAAEQQSFEPTEAEYEAMANRCGGDIDYEQLEKAEQAAFLSCVIRAFADWYNAKGSKWGNETIVIERVSAQGTEVTYHLRLPYAAAELEPDTLETYQAKVQQLLCEPSSSSMFEAGGSYRVGFMDKQGVELGAVFGKPCA